MDPDFFDDTELIEAWDKANDPNRPNVCSSLFVVVNVRQSPDELNYAHNHADGHRPHSYSSYPTHTAYTGSIPAPYTHSAHTTQTTPDFPSLHNNFAGPFPYPQPAPNSTRPEGLSFFDQF